MKYIYFSMRSFLIFLVLSLFTSHYVLALSEPPNLNTVNLGDAFSDVGNSSRYNGPSDKKWNNVEQITPNSGSQRGALWYKDPLDFGADFQGDFYLYLGDRYKEAGDGMTFIFQNNNSGVGSSCRIGNTNVTADNNEQYKQLCALGASGGAMGAYGFTWGNNQANKISRAIALEFDTYLNQDKDNDGSDKDLSGINDNHIALTVPKSLNKGEPISHYQTKGFRCSNRENTCLSNGSWRYIKYQWIEEEQRMLYWIKNREDGDDIATFCFRFGKDSCVNPAGETVKQPQEISAKQNAAAYFGDNKVYWGFTGSTGGNYAQQLVAVGKNPNQFQNPLDLKVSLKLDNNIDKSSFKASLEAFSSKGEWNLFKPEDSSACQDYTFNSEGEVHISVEGDEDAQKCLTLVKKYGGTNDYQNFRFIITESPAYYPQYDRYVVDSNDNPNPIVSSKTLSLNDSILGPQDFGTIDTRENKWGECPWDLNDAGVLTLNKEKSASYCTLGRGNYFDNQVAGIPKQKVTSINFISNVKLPSEGDQFFYRFKQVKKYDRMKNLDTSQATSMKDMFKSNLSLQELDLRDFDTSNVTSMESMFANLLEVKTLDLSSFNTSKVINMHSMFQIQKGNKEEVGEGPVESKLETIIFPNSSECSQDQEKSCWNTSSVENMSYMFHNQDKLKSLNVSLFDTQSVENMEAMFARTESLQELDLSKFNTENVTNMNSMFLNNQSLQELNLSSFDTKNADMSNMFAGSSAIEQLHLGKNFQFRPSDNKTQAALPNIQEGGMYTGGWVNLDRWNSFPSSEELMKNYNGQNDSGTYTRQKKTYLYVPETINFSGLLNYNEPQSIKPSSDAKVLASSYQGNWKVVMHLDSSNDLFEKYLYYDDKEQISISNGKEILKGNEGEEKELVLPLTMKLDPLASLDPLADEEYVGKLEYSLEITL